jgi:hypothetical protein
MSQALAQAARELLDAYAGDYPDALNVELVALAQELAVIEAEPIGPAVAAVEHMRAAEHYARRLSAPRLFKHIRDARERTEAHAGRAILPHCKEVDREAYRLADLPDPAPEELEK